MEPFNASRIVVTGLALWMSTGACSGGVNDATGDGGTRAGPEGTQTGLERDHNRILDGLLGGRCELTQRCLGPLLPLVARSLSGDLRADRCIEDLSSHAERTFFTPLRESIQAERLVYRPASLEACIEMDAARSCEDLSAPPDACLAAFEGQVPEGDPCTMDMDCRGDAFCDVTSECPSRCRARGGVGTTCTHPVQCERGLRCYDPDADLLADVPPSDYFCGLPRGEGQACHGPHCAAGLACMFTEAGDQLLCQALEGEAAEGQPCSVTKPCADGLACRASEDAGRKVCTPATAHMPCGQASDCSLGERCTCTDEACVDGAICMPLAEEGERCQEDSFRSGVNVRCAGHLVCEEGSCIPPRELGAPCSDDLQCESFKCLGGACVPYHQCEADAVELGSLASPCETDQDCDTGLFCVRGGPMRGLCSRECEGDDLCIARFGDGTQCSHAVCGLACDDDTSCPSPLTCQDDLCASG